MAQPQKKMDATYTYGDYASWDDDQRLEIIDGAAYAMAAPLTDHQTVVGEVFGQLREALKGKRCRAMVSPLDVRLPVSDEPDESVTTTVQPDVLIVCDPSKIDRKGVRGAPDFILEVCSPTNPSHDHVLKRRRYELAGVREYWIVHPTDRVLWTYQLVDGKFGSMEVLELLGKKPLTILPDIVVDWDELVPLLLPMAG